MKNKNHARIKPFRKTEHRPIKKSVRAAINAKMTTFKVPTNVQREDTIIGPVTMRQLIICAVGGAITYIIYVALAKKYYAEIWLIPVTISAILTATFAFVKVHGMTFIQFLLYLAEYMLLPRKRVFVKGAGDIFVSNTLHPGTQSKKEEKKEIKAKKSIDELVQIMDGKGVIKKPS